MKLAKGSWKSGESFSVALSDNPIIRGTMKVFCLGGGAKPNTCNANNGRMIRRSVIFSR